MRHLLRTIALAVSLVLAWLAPTAQAQDTAPVASGSAAPATPAERARPECSGVIGINHIGRQLESGTANL